MAKKHEKTEQAPDTPDIDFQEVPEAEPFDMKELEEAIRQRDEYLNMAQRSAAEFSNYKKRTESTRVESIDEGVREAVAQLLPTIDNMELAIKAAKDAGENGPLLEGVEMTQKVLLDAVTKLGMEEVPALGEMFDPELHNAVMHTEDETRGDNEIIEELQKGFRLGDKVIRFSLVAVAN